jgi:hypothetical protein
MQTVSENLFSNEELRMMEKRSLDRLLEALDAGDVDEARSVAKRMYNEFEAMHDLYRDWIAATLSTIGRRHGDEELEVVMGEGVRAWWAPFSEALGRGDRNNLAKRVRMFVAGLRGHLQPMHIEEDDEKIVIQMHPCGSGGRLVLEGKYEGPDALLQIEGAQTLTYGRESFPVYCAHEPPMEQVSIDDNGAPFVIVEPAHEIGREHCSFLIYKDPKNIPKRYYERVGRTKPAETS